MFDWASTLHIQYIIHTAILQLPLQIVHQLSPPIKLLQTLALFPQTVYLQVGLGLVKHRCQV